MKIRKLVIYGFGKHENRTFDFDDGINVIYGHNEAGKTTIQQFILHTIFGFPQKNSSLLRYEPKSGGKFGGQVHLFDELYGNCIIERVQGKSSGDVTVYFDGTQGGEEAVKTLMRQYDRSSFEAVFSFSLLQLQGFEKMDETELSRTLLSSGTTGVDTLMRVEKKLEKEMGELFKKTGRNPEMNVRVIELKEMEKELKNEQERISAYSPKMDRIREIEKEYTDAKTVHDSLREQHRTLELALQLFPLKERKQKLFSKLEEVRTTAFPSDGIRRYETVTGRLIELEAKARSLEAEITMMIEKMPSHPVPEKIADIERMLALELEWHDWRSTVSSIRENRTQLNMKKLRLLDRLGLDESDAILQSDVSIHQEEYLYSQLKELAEMEQQISYLDRQLSQLEYELRNIRNEQISLQKNGPSVEERKQADEWPAIRSQLAEAKAYLRLSKSNQNKGNSQLFMILLIVAAVAIIAGVVVNQWIVSGIGVFVAIIAIVTSKGQKDKGQPFHDAEMERFVETYAGQEAMMEALMNKVHDYDQKESRLADAALTVQRQMGEREEEYGTMAQEKERLDKSLTTFFFQYGLRKIPNSGILHEFFGMARSLQEMERELEEMDRQSELIQEKIRVRYEEVQQLIEANVPEQSIYEALREEYLSRKEKLRSVTTLTARIEEFQMQKQEAEQVVSSLQDQRNELFTEAGVETEEQYYEAYKNFQETQRLSSQIDDIDSQLAVHGRVEYDSDRSEEELREEIRLSESNLSEIENKMNSLVKEKTTLVIETEKLMTDDSYQRKQQIFEMKKAEFAELAKQWSIRQAIVEAIKNMMEELKEKKLPEVLTNAEKLFSELTGGAYVSLAISENGLFQAIARNGKRYPIIELSQATKEQAYIALRLSLAIAKQKSAPFPLLLDDPFVHFDETRYSRMLAIVERLSENHQFIYFTCHDNIVEYWANATILNVSNIGSAKGAMTR
ncbi:AAA family ATPase [Sporosarcina sp. ACRSL]|uniref:ATP-binding protein n=1 Tax=Sporosarcina sp. ACRSL TaxID=2918215 RepID=UPI001EF5F636|nr:AAA family ATPase [Sporosarcina sp. ACRSL]MCG7345583.1 AAA family ATPase [Sporosarcina sp. ACRSL]